MQSFEVNIHKTSMTFREGAKVILKNAGRPMTARELVAQALKRKLISEAGKTPWLTMGAQIAREIKYKGHFRTSKGQVLENSFSTRGRQH